MSGAMLPTTSAGTGRYLRRRSGMTAAGCASVNGIRETASQAYPAAASAASARGFTKHEHILLALLPQSHAPDKGVEVIAPASARGQALELAYIASAQDDVLGLQHGAQLLDHLGHHLAPLLRTEAAVTALPHVLLVRTPMLVGHVADLHRLDDSVHDQRHSQPGPEP